MTCHSQHCRGWRVLVTVWPCTHRPKSTGVVTLKITKQLLTKSKNLQQKKNEETKMFLKPSFFLKKDNFVISLIKIIEKMKKNPFLHVHFFFFSKGTNVTVTLLCNFFKKTKES
jgi:predicted RNase H-related nuclease YkuK (DUF458 family)